MASPPRLSSRGVLLALLFAAPAGAQFDLTLEVQGGSFPGQVDLHLCGSTPGRNAIIFLGINPGPTPIAMFDNRDSRSLLLGTELLGFPLLGGFQGDGCFVPPPIQVPNLPSLLDDPFFFQGASWPGPNSLVGELSNPRAFRFGPAGQFRDRLTGFSTPRAFFPVVDREDGTSLLIGGGDGSILSQFPVKSTEVYDPITDAFSPGPDMAFARSLHTATQLQDGRWLILGGLDEGIGPQNTSEIYDPVTNQFSAAKSMTDPRMGHTATALNNGKVLVAGGLPTLMGSLNAITSTLDTTEIYDPATDDWSPGPAMSTPRAGQSAIPLPDGRVALVGGLSFDVIFVITLPAIRNSVDIYDPVTNTIAPGNPMEVPRALAASVELSGDRVLVAGGISGISLVAPGTPTATAEIFDLVGGGWTRTVEDMATARGIHQAFDLGGGRSLFVGGASGDILTPVALSSTEIYDDQSKTWLPGPPMAQARAGFAVSHAPTGQVQILGGAAADPPAAQSGTEWYHR